MRKKGWVGGVGAGIAVFCFVCWAHAATPETSQDWNASDAKLFKKMKAESGKSDAEIYQELGFSYFKREMFDRAFLYFNAAVKTNPKLAWSWYYMGLLNLQDGEGYFEKAIEADSHFAPARYWLGKIYQKNGKTAAAIKAYNDYLKVAKDDPGEQQRSLEARGALADLKGITPPAKKAIR